MAKGAAASIRLAGLSLASAGRTTNGAFRIQIDPAEVIKTFNSLANVVVFMSEVVGGVEPEFGADMPYSSLLEAAYHPAHAPHIAPAIFSNAGFITSQLQSRLSAAAVRFGQSGTLNVSGATKEVEQIWEDILNSKPKADAQKYAPFLFGYHHMTIGGHGKQRSDSEIRALQHKLVSERNLLRRTLGKDRAGLS